MSSRHLIHPSLLRGLDLMQEIDLNDSSLTEIRQVTQKMIEAHSIPLPASMTRSIVTIQGGDGQPMNIIIFRPINARGKLGCIFHIHGGGYVMGTPEISEAVNIDLVDRLQCVLISVDYRIAPETPYPGPLEDCYAALNWLVREANELQVDIARIALRGESAGGGLAAALAILCRDNGGPYVCHQNLIYPMLDDRTGSAAEENPNPYAGEFFWTAASNRFGWTSLLGKTPGGENTPYLAAPARAPDLSGLPPTFISTGALDLFVNEDIEYSRRLIISGVPTELHVYPGAYHGFDIVADAPSTLAMRSASLAALKEALRD